MHKETARFKSVFLPKRCSSLRGIFNHLLPSVYIKEEDTAAFRPHLMGTGYINCRFFTYLCHKTNENTMKKNVLKTMLALAAFCTAAGSGAQTATSCPVPNRLSTTIMRTTSR